MKRGIVVKSTGSWYWVRLEEGNMVQCRIRGKFRMEGIRTTNPLVSEMRWNWKKEVRLCYYGNRKET